MTALCSRTLRECERRARRSGYGDLGDEFAMLAKRIEDELAERSRRVFFFGCWNRVGHYLHEPGGRYADSRHTEHPWGRNVDGVLQPADSEVEGRCLVHHKDGWTALAFWDRSVDDRGGCCAALIVEGESGFQDMLGVFETRFPEVLARFSFTLVQVHGESAGSRRERERGR